MSPDLLALLAVALPVLGLLGLRLVLLWRVLQSLHPEARRALQPEDKDATPKETR